MMLKSSAVFSFDYSAEQSVLIEESFHSKFLIAEELRSLDARNFILSGWSPLDGNIYLSGMKKTNILPKASLEIGLSDTLFSKTLIELSAQNEKLHGINFAFKGFYQLATFHFSNALIQYAILKDTQNNILLRQNLSELYILQHRLDEALKINYNTESLLIKSNKKNKLVDNLLQRVTIEVEKGNTKSAENIILKRVLAMGVNKKQEQECYLSLGKIYLQAKRYTEAKWFFIQANTLAEKRNSRLGKIKSLLLLAKVQNQVGDHSLALNNILKAKNLITNSLKIYIIDVEMELAQTYRQLNQKQKSNIHSTNFNSIKTSYIKPTP